MSRSIIAKRPSRAESPEGGVANLSTIEKRLVPGTRRLPSSFSEEPADDLSFPLTHPLRLLADSAIVLRLHRITFPRALSRPLPRRRNVATVDLINRSHTSNPCVFRYLHRRAHSHHRVRAVSPREQRSGLVDPTSAYRRYVPLPGGGEFVRRYVADFLSPRLLLSSLLWMDW